MYHDLLQNPSVHLPNCHNVNIFTKIEPFLISTLLHENDHLTGSPLQIQIKGCKFFLSTFLKKQIWKKIQILSACRIIFTLLRNGVFESSKNPKLFWSKIEAREDFVSNYFHVEYDPLKNSRDFCQIQLMQEFSRVPNWLILMLELQQFLLFKVI